MPTVKAAYSGGRDPKPPVGTLSEVPAHLMQNQQQRRDRDHGQRCGDEDGARGPYDVDVVLAGDDKHVGRDRECRAQQCRCGPERLHVEEKGGRQEEGCGVEHELHERHIGDLGHAAGNLAAG
jgi:hypothetical protein